MPGPRSTPGALALVGLLLASAATADEGPAGPGADPAATETVDATGGAEARPERKERRRGKKRRRARRGDDGVLLGRVGGWPVRVEGTVGTETGYLGGQGVRTDDAAVAGLLAKATVSAERDRWRVELPARASHRQTFGASLSETSGAIGPALQWRRGPRLRLEASAGVDLDWRPAWPDLYQPLPDGSYAETDRYGHWDRRLGAEIAGIPLRHQHARASWRYTLADYATDPAFDAVDAPTHLAPFDHARHEAELSWRYLGRGWKVGGGAELFWRKDFFLFARDRGTGRTHAGAGGDPPNPLQVRVGAEPRLEGELELAGGRGELSLGYGLELVDDVFEGYYSYTGHHPSAALEWRVGRLRLEGAVDLHLRRYGPGSYAEGPDHPPLTAGDRRVDRKLVARLDAEYPLGRRLAATLDVRGVVRRSNFPPYVPGVFPDTREYEIDWSYDNLLALVGLEARF